MEKSNDIPVREQAIVTIFLPPLSSGDLFEMHAAIKKVIGELAGYKMDFRILGQKGDIIPDGTMGYESGSPGPPTVGPGKS